MDVRSFERPAEMWEADPYPSYQNVARAVFIAEPDVVRVTVEMDDDKPCQILVRTPGYCMPEASRELVQAVVPSGFLVVFTGAAGLMIARRRARVIPT